MQLRQSTIIKKRGKHSELTQEVLSKLPAALQDPMMVYKSPGDSNAHAIVTSIPTEKGPVTAYFTVRERGNANVLEAKTVFGKDTAELLAEIREAQARNNITYRNKEAFDAWDAQGAGTTEGGTAIQPSQGIEDLRQIFAQPEINIKPKTQNPASE